MLMQHTSGEYIYLGLLRIFAGGPCQYNNSSLEFPGVCTYLQVLPKYENSWSWSVVADSCWVIWCVWTRGKEFPTQQDIKMKKNNYCESCPIIKVLVTCHKMPGFFSFLWLLLGLSKMLFLNCRTKKKDNLCMAIYLHLWHNRLTAVLLLFQSNLCSNNTWISIALN